MNKPNNNKPGTGSYEPVRSSTHNKLFCRTKFSPPSDKETISATAKWGRRVVEQYTCCTMS